MGDGTPHRFGPLKSVPDVEKIVTFDMDKAQHYAIASNALRSTDTDYCQNGTCAGHAMWWLAGGLTSEKRYAAQEGVSRRDSFVLLAEKVTPIYADCKKSEGRVDHALADLAQACELVLKRPATDEVLFEEFDLPEMMESIWHYGKLRRDGCGYYISLDVTYGDGKLAGHGVGAYRTLNGMRFFDPNAGAYKLKSDDATKGFTKKWVEINEGFGAGMNMKIKSATLYEVAPRNQKAIDFDDFFNDL